MRLIYYPLAIPAAFLLLTCCSAADAIRAQKRIPIQPEVDFAGIGPATAVASTPTTSAADPPCEKKFKNIQVLQGLPSSQLYPVMAFISNSLGVTCAHCHTTYFEEESIPEKAQARQMIRMTRGINRTQFQGQPMVTCNSCHNGREFPSPVPQIAQAG